MPLELLVGSKVSISRTHACMHMYAARAYEDKTSVFGQ